MVLESLRKVERITLFMHAPGLELIRALADPQNLNEVLDFGSLVVVLQAHQRTFVWGGTGACDLLESVQDSVHAFVARNGKILSGYVDVYGVSVHPFI